MVQLGGIGQRLNLQPFSPQFTLGLQLPRVCQCLYLIFALRLGILQGYPCLFHVEMLLLKVGIRHVFLGFALLLLLFKLQFLLLQLHHRVLRLLLRLLLCHFSIVLVQQLVSRLCQQRGQFGFHFRTHVQCVTGLVLLWGQGKT